MNTYTNSAAQIITMGALEKNASKLKNRQTTARYLKRLLFILFAMVSVGANAQFAVTTNGGSGLLPGYGSLAAAITALNGAAITSPVIITCAAGAETAPVAGFNITATGTAVNTIVIQGAGAGNSVITAFNPQSVGVRTDAIIKIVGGDYITIEGFTLQENAANTTTALATNNMTEIGIGLWLAAATNGAQNNTIQNNAISLGSTYQNAMGIFTSSSSSSINGALVASSTAGSNSNNKFYGNNISNVAYGMYFICEPLTVANNETGNDIGGSSALTGNTITFGRTVAADLTLTRFSGTNPAGIFFRNGTGNSVRFNTITSNSVAYAQTLGVSGVVMVGGGTTPNAAIIYTATISDNTVIINNTGAQECTGLDFGAGTINGTMVANNNNITINQNITAANNQPINGIKANYASATNTANGNSVIINQSTSSGSNSAIVTAINCAGAATTVNVSNNPEISIRQSTTGGTYAGDIFYINVSAGSGTVNVTGNTMNTGISSIRSNGDLICVNQNAATTVLDNFKSNIVNIDRIGTSGFVSFTSSSTAPNLVADSVSNNIISFTGLAGTSTVTVISCLGGTAASSKSICNNTISITGTNTGASKGIFWGYSIISGKINGNAITIENAATNITGIDGTSTSATANELTGNVISLKTSAISSPSMIGINCDGTGPYQVNNNSFAQMNLSGIITGTGTVTGIYMGIGTGNNINNNIINNFTVGAAGSTASPVVSGIVVVAGTVSLNVFKNKIYGIGTLASGTSTSVAGIRITGGTTNNVYNNYIGNLTAGAASAADAVRGISITSTTAATTHNIYYNTVYLNASSSGTNFGSSGIFHTISTTATTSRLNMRNNIIVNNSTPSGTGLTVAFRRSAGLASNLANYASTSNNNLFYAGTPAANRLIYYDVTSSAQTIAAYKAAVFTAGTIAPRDAASISENPVFVSTNGADPTYLHIDPSVATAIDGGAASIPGYTDDYDGDARNLTLPDIGADEFCVAPANLNYTLNTVSYCPNAAITPNNPTFSGSAATSYSVSPALPAGLILNTTTGVITGTPTTTTAAANYTITVNNSCGSTTKDVNITISSDATITLTSLAGTDAQTICYNAPIDPIVYTLGGTATGAGVTGLPIGVSGNYNLGVFTITGNPTDAPGIYNYTVTTTGSCTQISAQGSITVLAPPTGTFVKTNVSACGVTPDGTIAITPSGGTGPYSYVWSGLTGIGATVPYLNPGNVSSVSGLDIGFYNVTITDALGCSGSITGIHVQYAFSAFVTNNGSISSGCSNTGVIILYANAGVQPYTFSLDNITYTANNTFTNLAPATYTAYVKDGAGCIVTRSITIGAAAPVVALPFMRPASSCSNDGVIEIYRTGGISPFTYSLDGITYQGSNIFSNLPAGSYTAYVKDSKDCVGSANITVTQGAALNVTATKTDASTCINDGTIRVSVTGGSSPYTYSINGGPFQASNAFFGLANGNYAVTAKDVKGCEGLTNVTINLNTIAVTSYATAASDCASSNGSIQLFRTGGVGPYTYSIDGNTYQASNLFTGLTPGLYDGYVKDSKTCIGIMNAIQVNPNDCPPPPIANNNSRGVVIGNQHSGIQVSDNSILKVNAYPNPASSQFTVLLDGNSNSKVVLTVSDLLGRKVFQAEGNIKQQYRFGNNFKTGIYLLQVVQGETKKIIKLVKE